MKFTGNLIPGVILSFLAVASCEPFEKVSEVPEITFKSFELYEIDTLSMRIKTGELVFSFIDGNADIGVTTGGTQKDTLNLFLIPSQKLNGEYEPIEDVDTLKYGIRDDEKLTRVGQNKTIKGEIKLQIYYFLIPPYDTIRYDFYIKDRAGNQSNMESTSDIGF